MSSKNLVIFDTTLRDGEQSPGASMSKEEKLRIALLLEKLGVDVIEAGFAIASPGDFEAVQLVAKSIQGSRICSLARAAEGDIRKAAEAVKDANASRIHTFIATSPIHMKYKLQMTEGQVMQRAIDSVTLARNLCDDVEFSLEDGSRSEIEFMCQITEAAIKAGASTINIPDTVGYGEPGEYADLILQLMTRVSNSDQAIFSVHCHNDLGLAVANSLAAVKAGARQVECTINGLGERAGNAALEEIVMAVKTRSDLFDLNTRIDSQQIAPVSKLVSSITGFPVQPNKAIVGANAFAHEAGIHQDGVLKHRETYEIMRAEDVGWHKNKLVLGKHSGRAAVKARFKELGIEFSDPERFVEVFNKFKALADRKHEIFDEDLQALLSETNYDIDVQFSLEEVKFNSTNNSEASAELCINKGSQQLKAQATGDGVVDAVFKSIEEVVESGAQLVLYSVNAITAGSEALGEVTVRLEKGDRIVNGLGADTDIVVASAKAYIDAANLLLDQQKEHPQLKGI